MKCRTCKLTCCYSLKLRMFWCPKCLKFWKGK